jgi:glycosyltransferase involved in cell wall biosynthesis
MGVEVSIIIPVYNKESHLSDCLESVLNQSLESLEVMCVNDASEDRSGEILHEFANRDSRVRIIENRENIGPGQARNIGIDSAVGRFLRFVDADDLLPYESTEKLYIRAIEEGVDLVKGSLALFNNDDPSSYQLASAVEDKARTSLTNEESLWIPWWHTSCLISADLVRDKNLRYPKLIAGEDPVFLASVLVNVEHISLVGELVYLYRRYPKTCGSVGSSMQHVVDFLKHAALTKRIFTQHSSSCWYRGYGPFLLNDMRNILNRTTLDPDQQHYVDIEILKIWGCGSVS